MRSLSPTLLVVVTLAGTQAPAQTPIPPSAPNPIGTIAAATATVSGTLSLADGKAAIGGNAIVIAHDRTAIIDLARGGQILVCSTSALHAARGPGATEPAPLLLALDRGAVELHMTVAPADSILTPDLRFTVAPVASSASPAGTLDLGLRVAPNGDTCVENRGAAAPTLEVAEQFGSAVYLVRPNQHLLFEHGSLREVVDHETSPCGCPPAPVLSVADAGTPTDAAHAAHPGGAISTADPAAAHPFPAAESQGLAPTQSPAAAVPQAPANEPHAQVAATLGFNGDGSSFDGTGTAPAPAGPAHSTATIPAAQPAPAAVQPVAQPAAQPAPQSTAPVTVSAQAPPPPPAPSTHDVFHVVSGFFRRLFGGSTH